MQFQFLPTSSDKRHVQTMQTTQMESNKTALDRSLPMANPKHFIAILIALIAYIPQNLPAEKVDFQKQVVPILEERCWQCHGSDEQESGLRLDQRVRMLRGGDSGLPAMVPGKPEKSFLVEVINHTDEETAMPPDEEKLPAKEIAILTQWIAEGAVWPGQMQEVSATQTDHWSFQPVVRPPVPNVPEARTSVDAFLLHALEKRALPFSRQATPRELIRRASIVLTGLMPTVEETQTFVAAYGQQGDQAYTALIDRLLESPHFGERWAQHWLDVIRWAETNGSEANLYRKNAWIYRDYVVRSFNEDRPYDQFIREQIAGDALGTGEATGFLVAGPHVPAATVGREPSAIRQARADRMDEIMQTLGASVMGMTIGCARCHNHKFDPITITDYYALTAVFQGVEFGSRHPELDRNHPRRQAGERLLGQIAKQRSRLRKTGGWEENWGAYRELHFRPATTKSVRIRFKMPNVNLDELEIFGPQDRQRNLALKRQKTKLSGFPEKGNEGRHPIDRVNDGEYGTMAWRARTPKDADEKPWLRFDFEEPVTIDRLRMSSNREYFYDTDYLVQKPYLPRYEYELEVLQDDDTWKKWVGTWHVNKQLNKQHPERAAALEEIQRLIAAIAEEGPRPSFIGRFVPPQVTRVLLRGSPENPRGEVTPRGPGILQGDLQLTPQAAGRQRRVAFANWISKADNPLTARVMANRIWHHIFGSGIVSTTSDFGAAGARPTHPELLDWLAAEFTNPTQHQHAPWSVKGMIRLLVMSDAFRQTSQPDPVGMQKDANSTFLWRFPSKRVEAEVIRDSILLASGSLNQTIGGRGYRIHNVKKTYAQWEVLNNHGPETWRRMLYQERMRRVDDGMFTAFDFPDCGQVRAKRPVSTTPLQALNLMNSQFVIEQSQRIAKHAFENSSDNMANAVERCFLLLLGRAPDDAERQACLKLANDNHLELVCRALINSNEFAFLP